MQQQISAEKFQETCQEFIDKQIDISSIKETEPTFEEKTVEFVVLRVSGSYPTKAINVRFTLRYVQEGGEWKLLDINLKTTDTDAKKTPSDN